jgi:hypothetical protein
VGVSGSNSTEQSPPPPKMLILSWSRKSPSYGTRRFITMFRRAHHCTLFRSSMLSLRSGFQSKMLYASVCFIHAVCPTHLSLIIFYEEDKLQNSYYSIFTVILLVLLLSVNSLHTYCCQTASMCVLPWVERRSFTTNIKHHTKLWLSAF